jgi:ABC-2 type transport system permease protein
MPDFHMSHILAIANKELRSYFASPIAYVVIGVFGLIFGFMFTQILEFFVRFSMRAQTGMGMGGTPNVNEMMLRPLLQNIIVVLLLVAPLITMRTFTEEKRSGTFELLLTSPITDMQILLGKFAGALTLYLAMLLITAPSVAVLFWFGNPDWKPVVTAYAGLILLGGTLVSLGMFISTLTKNQIVAGMLTFSLFLMLLIVSWMRDSGGPITQQVVGALSLFEHFEDFSKGVVDTRHIVYWLSAIVFGLFLTLRSLDSERWRG